MQDYVPPKSSLQDEKAKLRANLLLEVTAGKITATQAAERLGVSRKTWHEWQARGLAALFAAMQDRPTGRPPTPVDEEAERLAKELEDKHREVEEREMARRIQSLLRPLPPLEPGAGSKKKP